MSSSEKSTSIWWRGMRNTWPVFVTIAIFLLFKAFSGTGNEFLDANVWPSAFICQHGGVSCSAILNFDRTIRMLAMCAAILPMLNYFDHFITISHIYRRLDKQESERAEILVQFALIFMAFVLILNGIWIALIHYEKFNADTDAQDWMTVLMFGFLIVVDVSLIFFVSIDQTSEGRTDLEYFFGSLFFVDIPTLVGLLAVIFVIGPSISEQFGATRFAIAQALYGGSMTMHIAVAQIAFVFLQLQRNLRNGSRREEKRTTLMPLNP